MFIFPLSIERIVEGFFAVPHAPFTITIPRNVLSTTVRNFVGLFPEMFALVAVMGRPSPSASALACA